MHARRGFTLVELLVVIAIIAMLVTLLLPAVQAAREAARRTQCQNNLKQLALGCINFESVQQHYPQTVTPGPCCDVQSYESWSIVILPFMEEQALFDRYNLEVSWRDDFKTIVAVGGASANILGLCLYFVQPVRGNTRNTHHVLGSLSDQDAIYR